MTQRGASLFGRVTTVTRHYATGPSTIRPTWTAASIATNSVFGVLNSMNGRQFSLLSPIDTTVWSKTPLQSLIDENGRIPVENVRNASQEQIQQRIDAIADNATVGSKYRAVRPLGVSDPHEYLVESTIQMSAGGIASLKQEFLERPDNVHRLIMSAIAMGAVPVEGERANQIVSVQQEAIASWSLPRNQLTDADVLQSNANFANGRSLESHMQLGPFNMIQAENPQTWTQGNRLYSTFTARTIDNNHIFDSGVAQHTTCLDLQTGMLHFSVVGAGTSQTGLAALGNVTSAASMWSNRSEVVAKMCDIANGQALNTFDLRELATRVTDSMDFSRKAERAVLKGLDQLSGSVVMLTDAWFNSVFALPDAAKPAIMDIIKTSYTNQEPYLPDDMLTPLKDETDALIKDAQARSITVRDNPTSTDSVGDGSSAQQDRANDTNTVQDGSLSDPIEPRPDPTESDVTNKDTALDDGEARVTTPEDTTTPDAVGRTNVDGTGPIDPGIAGGLDPTHPDGIANPDPGIPNPIDPTRIPTPGIDMPGGPTPIEAGPSVSIPHIEPGRGFAE